MSNLLGSATYHMSWNIEVEDFLLLLPHEPPQDVEDHGMKFLISGCQEDDDSLVCIIWSMLDCGIHGGFHGKENFLAISSSKQSSSITLQRRRKNTILFSSSARMAFLSFGDVLPAHPTFKARHRSDESVAS
ncbi:hypothetical protein HPP92_026325 [Vanilla planifolia]|uniref:Uncharacterized protein n=1 Tax=Vanilla planifolia TaxID=51239 RepID=A0A835PGF7_VANPL|nr:hypothetical protein HPP92_026325 [Vanilla planifolia]